jgi:hypothetical protein
MLPGTSFQKRVSERIFIIKVLHRSKQTLFQISSTKGQLTIVRTISAHQRNTDLILRPAKKYSSHDTIPVKYYCELTLRSRGSSRSSDTSARSLEKKMFWKIQTISG